VKPERRRCREPGASASSGAARGRWAHRPRAGHMALLPKARLFNSTRAARVLTIDDQGDTTIDAAESARIVSREK